MSLPLLADENFDHTILRGIVRKQPNINIITVQSAGLSGAGDEHVLEWAAHQGRVLLTHDASTMTRHAIEMIQNGKPMSGVIDSNTSIGSAIDDVLLIAECGLPEDFRDRIVYLPLR